MQILWKWFSCFANNDSRNSLDEFEIDVKEQEVMQVLAFQVSHHYS